MLRTRTRKDSRSAHPIGMSACCALHFFLKSSDATDWTIAGGVMKDGAELDFSSFETGEIAVLVEDFSMPVTQVITNFFSHNQ